MQRLLIIALWLMMGGVWLSAQEETPATPVTAPPTTTSIIDYRPTVDLIFPQAIYFEFLVIAPRDDFEQFTLTIMPPESEPLVVRFIEETPLAIEASYSIARYEWMIPRLNAPPLFSEIAYQVTIELTDGRQLLDEGTLTYQDERLDWIFIEENGFEIATDASTRGLANRLSARLNDMYRLMRINTGLVPEPLKVMLYPALIPPGCARNDEGEPVVPGRNEEGRISDVECDQRLANRVNVLADYLVVNTSSEDVAQAQIIPVLFDAFYGLLWGSAEVPAWFERGLMLFYQRSQLVNQQTLSQQALRISQPFSLSEMQTRPLNADDDLLRVWDAQAYGMVLYMADTVGVSPLFALAQAINPNEPFDVLYRRYMGQPVPRLIPSWQTWVFRREADVAYQYNPYLPITPTLTPTPTYTLTPTITPTLTATLPATDTVTPSRTPRPSRTPTPSLTPRPPQSFSLRPSATPSLTPTPLPGSDTFIAQLSLEQTAIISGAGLLVLLIVVLFFITERRR